jgi:acetone carboxylase gamma subunit
MEKIIQDIINGGITPEILIQLLVVILTIFLVLWIRGKIVRRLAYMRFVGSMDMSKDVVVREGTSTGYVDYTLESLDTRSIILRSVDEKLKMIIPTVTANDRIWITVQRLDSGKLIEESRRDTIHPVPEKVDVNDYSSD